MQVQTFSYPTQTYRLAMRDRILVRAVSVLCFAVVLAAAYLALAAPVRADTSVRDDGLFLRPMAGPAAGTPSVGDPAVGEAAQRPYRAAPRLAQTIRLDIAGVVARGSVTQLFRNDSSSWVEGHYKFPLPSDAAVDRLRIRVDDRVVEGVIQEREQAQRTYDQAREAGQTAALLTEERPNLFTISLANIGPGEVIAVDLEFQAKVNREGDAFEFRMPLVSAPRYLPDMELSSIDHPALRATIARQLEDAARLGFPIDLSRQSNRTALEVALDAGAEIASLESPTHDLVVSRDEQKYRIGLRLGEEPADRDIVLRWATERAEMPGAALFHESRDGTDYLLAMISPPDARISEKLDRPRDITFLIDTSGSMDGESMRAAKSALVEAILGLRPDDRFDIIEFDNDYSRLFGSTRPANRTAVDDALRFVAALAADGGTEMAGPLRAAMNDRAEPGYLRQVVFLTDGQVGNEDALFRMIEANLGKARLFTVGLGSAPNDWFMRKAAELGRGQTVSIPNDDDAAERMADFYRGIEQPVVVDLALAPGAGTAEVYPSRMPDLYGAKSLMIPVALTDWDGTLTFAGDTSDGPWQIQLDRSDLRPAAGVAKLWAESKVEAIQDTMRAGGLDAETGRLAVLDVAIPHRLATRYTSFVAVDATPRRPEGEALREGVVPNNLPDGMAMGSLAGPAGATGWEADFRIGAALIAGSLFLLLLSRRLNGGRNRRMV